MKQLNVDEGQGELPWRDVRDRQSLPSSRSPSGAAPSAASPEALMGGVHVPLMGASSWLEVTLRGQV